jgi:hypothetical protein
MNRLSKDLTLTVFDSPDGYQRLVRHWSGLMQDKARRKTLGAEHHLLYAAARGKDWRRGFAFTTNQRKLENGQHPEAGALRALSRFHSTYRELLEPFDGCISEAGLARLRKLVANSSSPLREAPYREVQMA